MSVCTFIASDCPLKEAAPVQDYPLEINLDNGQIYDGDADDIPTGTSCAEQQAVSHPLSGRYGL